MAEELELQDNTQQQGSDFGGYEKLVTLTPREHIRLRPGMYIGKLGDGSQSDDGIYVLMKEVIDNSIDEFNTGFAKPRIDITMEDGTLVPSMIPRTTNARLVLTVWVLRRLTLCRRISSSVRFVTANARQ